jgi:hypothetical protein
MPPRARGIPVNETEENCHTHPRAGNILFLEAAIRIR